jgi:hypothetical protein
MNMQEEIQDNWTRVRSGMTWVKMPRDAVKVVSALRYTGYRRDNPEEVKKKYLAGLSEECIEAGMKYLKEHENYIISKRTKKYGYGEEHVICKKPNMMYEKPKHWSNNYKGRAATLYGYQMKIPLEEWTRIVAEHWEGRQAIRDENSRAEQQQTLHKAIQNVEREEQGLRSCIGAEEIAQGAIGTFDDYRCGSSNSSHGRFSWALSYNTKFITTGEEGYDAVTEKYVTRDKGQLLPFDEAYEVRSIERMCKGITLPDLVTRVEELTTRYVEARRTYHAHSVVWYQVMTNIYNVMQAVCQQYIGDEEE